MYCEDVELIVLGSFVMLILVTLCRLLLCELVVSLLREPFGILKIVEHSWFRSSLRFWVPLGFRPMVSCSMTGAYSGFPKDALNSLFPFQFPW